MSMFSMECPCCGEKLNKYFLPPRPHYTGCSFIEGYHCFHCPQCENRISKPETAHTLYFKSAVVFIFLLILATNIRTVFDIWSDFDNGLANIPFMLIGLLLFDFLYLNYINFECFDDSKKKKVMRDNSDMLIFNNEQIRIDQKEKNAYKNIIYGGFFLIGLILIYIILKKSIL